MGVPKLLLCLGFICTQGFLQQMVQLLFVQLSAVSGTVSCVAALRHFGITSRTDKERILFFPARITRMAWDLLAPERFSSCHCSRVTGLYLECTRSQSSYLLICLWSKTEFSGYLQIQIRGFSVWIIARLVQPRKSFWQPSMELSVTGSAPGLFFLRGLDK